MEALSHCFSCEYSNCDVPYCVPMRAVIKHYIFCTLSSCSVCKEFKQIVEFHVKTCTDILCKVPHHLARLK